MSPISEIFAAEERRNRIKFFAFIIPEFARSYKMNKQAAYQYLKLNGGIDYLLKHWCVLHTDNPIFVVRDLFDECSKNLGKQ